LQSLIAAAPHIAALMRATLVGAWNLRVGQLVSRTTPAIPSRPRKIDLRVIMNAILYIAGRRS
jgi:hypothetical protein